MTKPKQPELNWDEVPPQRGDEFDFDVDIGEENEADMAAMHCAIVGRVDPLLVDETVFSKDAPTLGGSAEIARDMFADERRTAAHRQIAADQFASELRPALRRGQQPNENVRRFELVLSAYAIHGVGSHSAVTRMAVAEGVGEQWFKKWRRLLPEELIEATQAAGRVATYGPDGIRFSDPLAPSLWGRRYGLIKASERREAPERWGER